jgi:hypothetical protein
MISACMYESPEGAYEHATISLPFLITLHWRRTGHSDSHDETHLKHIDGNLETMNTSLACDLVHRLFKTKNKSLTFRRKQTKHQTPPPVQSRFMPQVKPLYHATVRTNTSRPRICSNIVVPSSTYFWHAPSKSRFASRYLLSRLPTSRPRAGSRGPPILLW